MKLEDLPKKPIFNVPEGYFEQLPGKIQARIETQKSPERAFVFRYRLQYVVPVILLAMAAVLWFNRSQSPADVETILASIETEQLVAYLNDSELTTEDVLEEVDFNSDDIDDIETEVYQLQLEDEVFDGLENDL